MNRPGFVRYRSCVMKCPCPIATRRSDNPHGPASGRQARRKSAPRRAHACILTRRIRDEVGEMPVERRHGRGRDSPFLAGEHSLAGVARRLYPAECCSPHPGGLPRPRCACPHRHVAPECRPAACTSHRGSFRTLEWVEHGDGHYARHHYPAMGSGKHQVSVRGPLRNVSRANDSAGAHRDPPRSRIGRCAMRIAEEIKPQPPTCDYKLTAPPSSPSAPDPSRP